MQLYLLCQVNLLFTTDVEGIHVPNRSTMIYFDLPTTGRSYVQLKGQACQNYFQHVMMLERFVVLLQAGFIKLGLI